MFNKKLFAAVLFSVSALTTVGFAQNTPPSPATPPSPPSPPTQIFESFTNGSSYLGVQTQEVTKDNFSKFGLREVRGVAVERVMENSPAAQAGLQVNDVIVSFNGEPVTSVRKLTRLIGEVAPDHQVRLTVLRGGNEREVTATLARRPGATFGEGRFEQILPVYPVPGTPRVAPIPNMPRVEVFPNGTFGENVFTFGTSRQIGVGVSSLTKQLGEHFGVSDGKGILINNVRENSPAAKAGLRAGDVIVEVDGKAVERTSDLTRALGEKKEGEVTLTIVRNKNRQTVRVTPEKSDARSMLEFYQQESRNLQPRLRQLMRTAPRTTFTRPSRTLFRAMPRVL